MFLTHQPVVYSTEVRELSAARRICDKPVSRHTRALAAFVTIATDVQRIILFNGKFA